MAKRYKQSVKDRMAESRGMERYETKKKMKKKMKGKERVKNKGYDEHPSNRQHRMRMEKEGHSWLKEDYNKIANMPQDVMYGSYPKTPYFRHDWLNDTLSGIDDQISADIRKEEKSSNKKDSKY